MKLNIGYIGWVFFGAVLISTINWAFGDMTVDQLFVNFGTMTIVVGFVWLFEWWKS